MSQGRNGPRHRGSTAEMMLQARIEKSAKASPLLQKAGVLSLNDFPQAAAPDLSHFQVRVDLPAEILEEAIWTRVAALLRANASRKICEVNDIIALGDDVELDVMGYVQGKLLPYSERRLQIELQENMLLPGFFEELAGLKVGSSKEVIVELPEDYPDERYRGVKAFFLVDIRSAVKVEMPALDDLKALKKLGVGETYDAIFVAIAEQLKAERVLEIAQLEKEAVLEKLADSALSLPLKAETVEREIREKWNQQTAPFLTEKGLSAEELQESLAGWLTDEAQLTAASDRIRASLVLQALIEQEKIRVEEGDPALYLADELEEAGLSLVELNKTFNENKELREQALLKVLYEKAMDFVLEQAEFSYYLDGKAISSRL